MRCRLPILATSAWALLGASPAAQAAQEPPPLDRRYDFSAPTGRAALPDAVVEASGLTLAPDGRLLVHGDERAVVLALDPATGSEVARFTVGRPAVEADFEGIATVGVRLFLVASTGLLYEFRDPGPAGAAPYRLTDTGVGRACEVEGLDHDPTEGVLLLACKTEAPPRDHALVHRIPLEPGRATLSAIRISRRALSAFGVSARLSPSAVAVDPSSSRLLVLAARERLLVEVERSGRVRAIVRLPRERHPQAEGLAIGADGTLYLADEARGGDPAYLTWYAPLPAAQELDPDGPDGDMELGRRTVAGGLP